MPSIGPQLPSHLSKRKRTASPSPPKSPPPEPQPTRPPNDNTNADEIDLDLDADDEDAPAPSIGPSLPPSTKNNTIGPSLPPPSAPNDDPRPIPDPDSGGSDSDSDDYGPSLPSSAPRPSIGPSLPPPEEDTAPKRDAWMLAPPPAKTTYTERDPTRLRARKFASKPTPVAAPSSSSQPSVWTETPEEKLRRLQDSVLGRSAPDSTSQTASRATGPTAATADDRDRNIAAAIQAQRGSSLYEEHDKKRRRRGAAAAGEEEDDPSKRAFDRDKDMALGGKITTAQRRELVSKSANFGGRFQKGSYL
ncbi:hypothetical protein CP532_5412 [Ophiocordyceps camponoti-leonardi (nom. inval.)]|nr:hypothetical protein CP532_5412 [Ophiocordyceps camponoti-leonardi (nom. inval.)]